MAGHGAAAVDPLGHHLPVAHTDCRDGLLHAYPAGQVDSLMEPVGQ